jgi:hemolysin III
MDIPRPASEPDPSDISVYPLAEEIANSVTHGLGLALAVSALCVLVVLAARHGGTRHIVGVSVFGVALVAMFLASTLYHAIPHARAKGVLQLFDHAAIYLAIAGTYTPFMLVTIGGAWGWSLLAIVWVAGLAGITLRAVFGRRAHVLRVALYVVMGWVGIVVFRPMVASVGAGGAALVFGGGIVYTLGIGFYSWQRLPYHHAIWHLFVLGGSFLHFLAVLWYVIPHSGV